MSAKPCSLRLITLLGIHNLLQGELALGRIVLFSRIVKIEDHNGAVGEFCWELEALWGCSLDELAAGAAVAYCQEGFDALDAHDIGESVYHALLQRAASFSSEGDQVLARIDVYKRQAVHSSS